MMKYNYSLCIVLAMMVTILNIRGQLYLPAYNSLDVLNVTQSLPTVRQVNGVSKIIVDYEGEWTASQRQAFAYACEIWEEAMPTTFPIRVSAVMDDTCVDEDATDESLLYEVIPTIRPDGNANTEWDSQTYQVQPKGYAFCSMSDSHEIYHYDLDLSYFNAPDMVIVYYLYHNMDDIYSYSRDETHVGSKYDFVTTALRNIAKGLGFSWSYYRAKNNKLWVDSSNLSPFEYFVYEKLKVGNSSNDSINCYLNATSNNFSFTDGRYESYRLYAPSLWDPVKSLNYFVAEDDNLLSQLLRWDFGRGTVLRDIIDSSVYNAFRNLLAWDRIWIPVGMEQPNNMYSEYDTEASIPMDGQITIDFPEISSQAIQQKSLTFEESAIQASSPLDSVQRLMQQFHPCYYNGSINTPGWIASIQKNDGTWDAVYYDVNTDMPFEANVVDFTLHEPLENYARTYDGHLRCRVAFVPFPAQYLKRRSYYFILDAKPLEVDVEPQKSRTVAYFDEDEYTKMIRVDIGNLEGVTKVVVAQLDDWADIPYYYNVPNYKDGYFLATVDVEFPTVFTIYAYNSVGYSTRTVTYTPTNQTSTTALSFKRIGNTITIASPDPSFCREKGSIVRIMPGCEAPEQVSIVDNQIDISSLRCGMYVLNVVDADGKVQSFKFAR